MADTPSNDNTQPEQPTPEAPAPDQPEQPAEADSAAKAEEAKKSNKKVLIIIGVVVGALILLSVAGTALSAYFGKKFFEKGMSSLTGSDVKVDTKKGKVSIKGDDGENAYEIDAGGSGKVKLADDYPSYLPSPHKKAKLVGTSRMKIGEGLNHTAQYMTKNTSVDEVFSHYQKEFKRKGFETSMESQSGDSAILSARNEAKHTSMTVSISPDSDNPKDTGVVVTSIIYEEED